MLVRGTGKVMVSGQITGQTRTNPVDNRTNPGQSRVTIRTNPAEPDKTGPVWIEAATTSRRLFVGNATTACPLTLAERVAWSFLLLPLAEDRGATRARITHGTGLGEQAVATAVAGLLGNGLAKVIDHQIKAVRPKARPSTGFDHVGRPRSCRGMNGTATGSFTSAGQNARSVTTTRPASGCCSTSTTGDEIAGSRSRASDRCSA